MNFSLVYERCMYYYCTQFNFTACSQESKKNWGEIGGQKGVQTGRKQVKYQAEIRQ